MEIPAEISGLPVLLEQKTEDDVRQTQVQPECDMPAVSIPDVTNWGSGIRENRESQCK